jgi:hypothetical protein
LATVADVDRLCQCELTGEIEIVSNTHKCELCVVSDQLPFTVENVKKALDHVRKQRDEMMPALEELRSFVKVDRPEPGKGLCLSLGRLGDQLLFQAGDARFEALMGTLAGLLRDPRDHDDCSQLQKVEHARAAG